MIEITFEDMQGLGFINNWCTNDYWSVRYELDERTWLTMSKGREVFIEHEMNDPIWIGRIATLDDVKDLLRVLKSGVVDAA